MASTASSSVNVPSRRTYSCIRCADRKVRCDRQKPCSACVKQNVDCTYHPSPAPRKRRKRTVDPVLTDRLRYYETLLQEQGIDPNELPNDPKPETHHDSSHGAATVPQEPNMLTPSSVESEPIQSINKTQVLQGQGRSKFIDNYLWTRVVEEFNDPQDALEDSSLDDSDPEASDDDLGFVLGIRPKSHTKIRHPPNEIILQLWQIFVERIDPLTKVVHVPTLQPAIQKAASDTTSIPRTFEALMFAIYSAAVMSLTDEECGHKFSEHRRTLLSRYSSATKRALSKAKFMGTISLVVLQALVIHILSIRDSCEPRAVWSLTGVAVRISQSMGLERDGTSLGLPPFEAEMRRRLWWLLKTHDFRTAEMCGLPKFRDIDTSSDSTRWPTNANDDQLYPGMPETLPEPTTLTDSAFISLRYELANFASLRIAKFRQQGKSPSQWDLHAQGDAKQDIEEAFGRIERLLETKYLRYCDPSQPLHLMTMLAARSSMNIVRFLTHHPRRWPSIAETPPSEREWVWEICIKFLEQYSMLQTSIQLKRFAWQASYFLQWHVFIHVLDTICADPNKADIDKGWQLISTIYESTPQMIYDIKKPIHVAVGNLCLKAYAALREATRRAGKLPSPEPDFIVQLRQQREVAMTRRQARGAKNSQQTNSMSYHHEDVKQMSKGLEIDPAGSSSASNLSYFLQQTSLDMQNLPQPNGAAESDPFWFLNGLDSNQNSGLHDMMDMDATLLLTQDYNMGDDANQAVTWEQWDTWLAESNVMRPMPTTWDLGLAK